MGKRLEGVGEVRRRMALNWTLSRRQRVDLGAYPQTWEPSSKDIDTYRMVMLDDIQVKILAVFTLLGT